MKRRGLWDSSEIERRKQIVARIPKSQRPPSEYRVSTFMTDNGHWYVDLRVYKGHAGRALPTGTGLPIHSSKVRDVIAALRNALRRDGELDTGASGALWDGWTAAERSAS